MANQIVSASVDQIAAFKMGAAQRYKERGVQPNKADQLFNKHVEKMAAEMGVGLPVPPKVQKVAQAIRAAVGR